MNYDEDSEKEKNTLLSIPRYLLLSFFFLLGPLYFLINIINITTGRIEKVEFWVIFIITSLVSFLFYRAKREGALGPQNIAKLLSKIESGIEPVKETIQRAMAFLRERTENSKTAARRKQVFLDLLKKRSNCNPLEVIVLGGAGWENKEDSKFTLSMDASTIYMSDLESLIDTAINIDDLRDIEISGPGTVTTNAGVMGGGFGAEGALKGMAIATVINILTTYSNTKTFIRMGFQSSEIVMLTSQIEPDKARILLSPLFLKVNRKPTEEKTFGVSDEIHKLYQQHREGIISAEEFSLAKKKLLTPASAD